MQPAILIHQACYDRIINLKKMNYYKKLKKNKTVKFFSMPNIGISNYKRYDRG